MKKVITCFMILLFVRFSYLFYFAMGTNTASGQDWYETMLFYSFIELLMFVFFAIMFLTMPTK